MRRIVALAATAAAFGSAVLVMPSASALPAECNVEGPHAGAHPGIVKVSTPAKTFYVDDRGLNGTWIYEETNGVGNLQRKAGNDNALPVVGKTLAENGSSETCTDPGTFAKPDTLYL